MDHSSELIRIGDFICLYSEDAQGYIYSDDTSVRNNGLRVYSGQTKDALNQIPNVQVVTFQILTQNRYKLNKRYRKLQDSIKYGTEVTDSAMESAKLAAEAEIKDNLAEQKRLLGRPIAYGDTVQLRHVFTDKYILMSTTDTSTIDKNKMMVNLQDFNSKHAQFRILPRYKVKVEGEEVELEDQIVLESIKAPGNYLHVTSHPSDERMTEVNCGTDKSVLSLLKHYTPEKEQSENELFRGGSIVQLFHKELEAYLAAEGIFGEPATEQVHLRVRVFNHQDLRSLAPPKNCGTYWQIVAENSAISGDAIKWEDKFHLRHMTSRLFLDVSVEGYTSLVEEASEDTLFQFFPLMHGPRTTYVQFEHTVRICHTANDSWLHGTSDIGYIRQSSEDGDSLDFLNWDNSKLLQIKGSTAKMYPDAFILRAVASSDVSTFNYVTGLIPFTREIIELKLQGDSLTARDTLAINKTFDELEYLVSSNDDKDHKSKQNVLRHTKLIDKLVDILQCPLDGKDRKHLLSVHKNIYDVLYYYAASRGTRNMLYGARFINKLQTQLHLSEGVGLQCCLTVIELIKDNRSVIDRIKQSQVQHFIDLLLQYEASYFLDLLGTLCVCNGIAITENQIFIAESLIVNDKKCLYKLSLGKDVGMSKSDVHISTDGSQTWKVLQYFVNESSSEFSKTKYDFLFKQLDLYTKLCWGKNTRAIELVTQTSHVFSWNVAFSALKSKVLPDKFRAKVCDVITGLYLDGEDTSTILLSNNFVYKDINTKKPNKDEDGLDIDGKFPGLWSWMKSFFGNNSSLVHKNHDRNIFMKEVLQMLAKLTYLGYIHKEKDLKEIKSIVMNYLKASNTTSAGIHIEEINLSENEVLVVDEPTEEDNALINVQLQALNLVELLLRKQFTRRLKFLIAEFKETDNEMRAEGICRIRSPKFAPIMSAFFDSNLIWDRLTLRLRINMLLKNMSSKADFIGADISQILFRLLNSSNEVMKTKCLSIMNQFYSSKQNLLKTAMRAQLLVSEVSEDFHHEAISSIPELRRLAMSKVDEVGFEKLCSILDRFISLCHVQGQPHIPHTVGQNILVNNGILDVILELATQNVDKCLQDRYRIIEVTTKKALTLLQYLAKGNEFIQDWIFDQMDRLLFEIGTSGTECALALVEAFKGRPLLSLKVQSSHITRIVEKCGQQKETAYEWLLVLKALAKDSDSGIVIRRNQVLITKALTAEFSKAMFPMEMTQDERLGILFGDLGQDSLNYYRNLVDLLASCAEGDNEYIESLCQKLLSYQEILMVLNSSNIDIPIKTAFARFLVWGYINITRSPVEIGAEDLCHDRDMWDHMKSIESWMKKSKEHFSGQDEMVAYMVEIGFNLIKGFFARVYEADGDFPEEVETLKSLAEQLQSFCPKAVEHATTTEQIESMSQCLNVLMTRNALEGSAKVVSKFYNKVNPKKMFDKAKKKLSIASKSLIYDAEEMRLNETFHGFCQYLQEFAKGKNTVAFQRDLYILPRYKAMEYTATNNDIPLPLGVEFQDFVQCFVESKNMHVTPKYYRAFRLLEQLELSYNQWPRSPPKEQEELDLKSLQLLRAMLHNLVIILPPDWEQNTNKWKSSLDRVKHIQDTLSKFGIVTKILPLMSRINPQFGKQVFALLDLLLFNANRSVQTSMFQYFTGTQEEEFFIFTQTTLNMSVLAIKERRNMENQKKARLQAAKKIEEESLSAEKHEKENGEVPSSSNADQFRSRMAKLSKLVKHVNPANILAKNTTVSLEDKLEDKEEDYTAINDMQMIMRVAGGLCDGQYREMQDYFRQQPDNINSVDIVAQFTHLISVIYSHIDASSIGVCTELFSTLHEMCEGNEVNKATLLNNKIVDYLNLLLRKRVYEGCTLDQVQDLRLQMGQLLYSLVEEKGNDSTAKDVCQTVSLNDLRHIIAVCYGIPSCEGKLSSFVNGLTVKDMDAMAGKKPGFLDQFVKKNKDVEKIVDIGFIYYYIIATMYDIDKNREMESFNHPLEETAFLFFKSQCKSVEVMKNGQLEKKHFRVRNENLLREEVKQTLKYEIDRTSPTAKLRDLLNYSKDILKDIDYQKKLYRSHVVAQLAKRWQLWSLLCIVLSFCINVLMLVTWKAPYSVDDIPGNATSIPTNSPIYKIKPEINYVNHEDYELAIYIVGGVHCLSSFMLLLCYLLLYHPALPTWFTRLFQYCRRNNNDVDMKNSDLTITTIRRAPSKLQVFLFSPATLYYVMMLAFSVLGTVYYGYFFAFHLFGIIDNNPLLRGVIKAVTLNGKSLIWVGILGVIVLYVYGLISFAFFRSAFSPGMEMFCNTLAECFVTVIRHGTVGDISGTMLLNPLDAVFNSFGYHTVFQVTFFIIFTTILLNVIFGIIVDTFSQIRDTKWVAEKDMKDTCFICSRDSFDFEHNAKGFDHHVREEHNIWAYIFYFIYLQETEQKDYTSIDMHVANMVKGDKLEFFPLNCALSLSSVEEEGGEDDIKQLVAKLDRLEQQHLSQTSVINNLLRKLAKDDKPKSSWKRLRSKVKRRGEELPRSAFSKPTTMSTYTDSTVLSMYDSHLTEDIQYDTADTDSTAMPLTGADEDDSDKGQKDAGDTSTGH